MFHPWHDGSYLLEWMDGASFAEGLAAHSPADAHAYSDYHRTLDDLASTLRPLLLRSPPGGVRAPGDVADWLRAALHGRLANRRLAQLTDLMTLSVADYLRQWFSHPKTLAAMCGSGVIGTWAGPETPGTAYVLMHHVIGEVAGVRGGWGIVRGGMGAISEAIAASARAAGADVRTEAAVEQIRVSGGRATGVRLASGEELTADVVLASCHPRTTLLDLVGDRHLPAELATQMRTYRSRSPVVKINCVLGELPRFACLEGTDHGPRALGEFMLHQSIEEVERAWDDAKYGRAATRPFIDGCVHSAYDDSLVPAGSGHHTLSLYTQFAPYELAEGSWETEREAYYGRVMDVIGEFAPNVPGAVLHHEVLAPPDLERIFGLVGGNIFHGEMTLDQLYLLRPAAGAGAYRTPVRGLYLCGSGSHPGGGVMGSPGMLGARTALRDLRLRRLLRR